MPGDQEFHTQLYYLVDDGVRGIGPLTLPAVDPEDGYQPPQTKHQLAIRQLKRQLADMVYDVTMHEQSIMSKRAEVRLSADRLEVKKTQVVELRESIKALGGDPDELATGRDGSQGF
jgi:hypothetical protein